MYNIELFCYVILPAEGNSQAFLENFILAEYIWSCNVSHKRVILAAVVMVAVTSFVDPVAAQGVTDIAVSNFFLDLWNTAQVLAEFFGSS